MKRINIILLFALIMLGATFCSSAAEKSIFINEVMTRNIDNVEDSYGNHDPWIELYNASFSTVNIKGYYITTDKHVLDKNMEVTERVKLMFMIPKNNPSTSMGPRQHFILWADGKPELGDFHTSFALDSTKDNWIAVYDGNGFTLVDSVTIPPIPADCSYALNKDGITADGWSIKGLDGTHVTPSVNNMKVNLDKKVHKFKEKDSGGIGMSIIAMSVVFLALLLMYIFFKIEGNIADKMYKTRNKKIEEEPKKENILKTDNKNMKDEEIICAIGLALHEFQEDVHIEESGIITIKRSNVPSAWCNKALLLRHI